MATGDVQDIVARLRSYIPTRWFPPDAASSPVLTGVLTGVATVLSGIYGVIVYARAQTRIATASDGWLDLISLDYFGAALPRRLAEPDATYRARILSKLLSEKNTRNGMIKALFVQTGRVPIIFEPMRPMDCGGYAPAGTTVGYGLAYASAPGAAGGNSLNPQGQVGPGGYGNLAMKSQALIIAFRPGSLGIPNVDGYGGSYGGYSTPSALEWATLGMITGSVDDASIYATIDATKPAGTIPWTQLRN